MFSSWEAQAFRPPDPLSVRARTSVGAGLNRSLRQPRAPTTSVRDRIGDTPLGTHWRGSVGLLYTPRPSGNVTDGSQTTYSGGEDEKERIITQQPFSVRTTRASTEVTVSKAGGIHVTGSGSGGGDDDDQNTIQSDLRLPLQSSSSPWTAAGAFPLHPRDVIASTSGRERAVGRMLVDTDTLVNRIVTSVCTEPKPSSRLPQNPSTIIYKRQNIGRGKSTSSSSIPFITVSTSKSLLQRPHTSSSTGGTITTSNPFLSVSSSTPSPSHLSPYSSVSAFPSGLTTSPARTSLLPFSPTTTTTTPTSTTTTTHSSSLIIKPNILSLTCQSPTQFYRPPTANYIHEQQSNIHSNMSNSNGKAKLLFNSSTLRHRPKTVGSAPSSSSLLFSPSPSSSPTSPSSSTELPSSPQTALSSISSTPLTSRVHTIDGNDTSSLSYSNLPNNGLPHRPFTPGTRSDVTLHGVLHPLTQLVHNKDMYHNILLTPTQPATIIKGGESLGIRREGPIPSKMDKEGSKGRTIRTRNNKSEPNVDENSRSSSNGNSHIQDNTKTNITGNEKQCTDERQSVSEEGQHLDIEYDMNDTTSHDSTPCSSSSNSSNTDANDATNTNDSSACQPISQEGNDNIPSINNNNKDTHSNNTNISNNNWLSHYITSMNTLSTRQVTENETIAHLHDIILAASDRLMEMEGLFEEEKKVRETAEKVKDDALRERDGWVAR